MLQKIMELAIGAGKGTMIEQALEADWTREPTALELEYAEKYPELLLSERDCRDLKEQQTQEEYCRKCEGYEKCEYNGLQREYRVNEDKTIDFYSYPCAERASYQRRVVLEKNAKASNLPEMRVERLIKDEEQIEVLRRYEEEKTNEWYYISGPMGTGKTYIASRIGYKALQTGKKVRFWNVAELMSRLKPGSEELDKSIETDLLILDDIGTEYKSEWSIERLYVIIDSRYRQDKRTILTSNYSLKELNKQYSRYGLQGSRISSRIGRKAREYTMREKKTSI